MVIKIRTIENIFDMKVPRPSIQLIAIIGLTLLGVLVVLPYPETTFLGDETIIAATDDEPSRETSKTEDPFREDIDGQLLISSIPWRERYYWQVFEDVSSASNETIIIPNVAELCRNTAWRPNFHVNCNDISGGLFNQVNMIRTCIRMAIDLGASLILPSISQRDSKNLENFHKDDKVDFGHCWDEGHIMAHLKNACPQMQVFPSDNQKEAELEGAESIEINVQEAPGFKPFLGYFDTTRTLRSYVDEKLKQKRIDANWFRQPLFLQIPWTFLALNPENDSTGLDWRVWTEISLLLRPPVHQRTMIKQLAERLEKDSYIGVHLRVESDTRGKWWEGLEKQATEILKSADTVAGWYRQKHEKSPPIYVACGDKGSVDKFKKMAADMNHTVVDKWSLMNKNSIFLGQMERLTFDEMGLLDYAMLLRSYFFLGSLGSSFSFTVANMRNDIGKYAGSGFTVGNQGSPSSHLFMPPPQRAHYACCL